MQIRLKLIDIFRDYLPPGTDVSNFVLDVQKETMLYDIFFILGIPDDLPRVTVCNSQIVHDNPPLSDGDVIAIFSPVFGG